MRLMITGGGTGGHTSPAVAIYEELAKRDSRLVAQWVGRKGAIEERVAKSLGIPFRSLPVEGWPRRRTPRKAWVAAKFAWSAARAWVYLRKFNPQVVLGVGGYVSLPITWTAQRRGIATVLHEQNRLLGVANRLAAPRAERIFLSFPDTIGSYPADRARVVGNPVRAAFSNPPSRMEACERFGLDPAVPVLLVSGGSQGAKSINDAVLGLVSTLSKSDAQVIWLTGPADAARVRSALDEKASHITIFPFLDDMAGAVAAADLVVARAGASTTAELAAMHKPSVLIPFPHAADNHQEHNAQSFESSGAAVLLRDSECTPDRLGGIVRELLAAPERLAAMGTAAGTLAKPGAADVIAGEILSLVFAR